MLMVPVPAGVAGDVTGVRVGDATDGIPAAGVAAGSAGALPDTR